MSKAFVTGGSGFLGTHLVKRLLSDGWSVDTFDPRQGDNLTDSLRLVERLEASQPDIVFHFAAHANVRRGPDDPTRDFEINTRGTFNVLEAMRRCSCRRIVFASSCSVYGEPAVFPSREDGPTAIQTSLYGASKIAGEALIQAYESTFGFAGTICRFVSILGPGTRRGHVMDLYRKLKADPTHLHVMGDGHQKKAYLDIDDCIDAVMRLKDHQGVFNVGGDTWTVERTVVELVNRLGVYPQVIYTNQARGWVGDAPHIEPDCWRLRALGWAPTYTTRQSVQRTIDDLEQRWAKGEMR